MALHQRNTRTTEATHMYTQGTHSIVESFRISEYENRLIEKLISKLGCNRSQLIRFAITRLAADKLQEARL